MAFISDTHKIISRLREKGFTAEQAEGFVDVVKEFETEELATKGYLRQEISDLRNEILKMMTVQGIAIIGLTVALIQLLGA